MENFLFLLVILLLQLITLKTKILLIKAVFGIFGILLSIVVPSEMAYPYFNLLSFFVSFINILSCAIDLRG